MVLEENDAFEKTQDAIIEVRYEFIVVNDKNISGICSRTIRALVNRVAEILNADWAMHLWLKGSNRWVQDYLGMTINCGNDPDLDTTRWTYSGKTSEDGVDRVSLVRCFNKYLDEKEIELMMDIIERLMSLVSQPHEPKQDSFEVFRVKERETITRFHTRTFSRVPF